MKTVYRKRIYEDECGIEATERVDEWDDSQSGEIEGETSQRETLRDRSDMAHDSLIVQHIMRRG